MDFQTHTKENKTMTEQTRACATCTENDGGLCDLKGILMKTMIHVKDGAINK